MSVIIFDRHLQCLNISKVDRIINWIIVLKLLQSKIQIVDLMPFSEYFKVKIVRIFFLSRILLISRSGIVYLESIIITVNWVQKINQQRETIIICSLFLFCIIILAHCLKISYLFICQLILNGNCEKIQINEMSECMKAIRNVLIFPRLLSHRFLKIIFLFGQKIRRS